jgi:hypothetical protein
LVSNRQTVTDLLLSLLISEVGLLEKSNLINLFGEGLRVTGILSERGKIFGILKGTILFDWFLESEGILIFLVIYYFSFKVVIFLISLTVPSSIGPGVWEGVNSW